MQNIIISLPPVTQPLSPQLATPREPLCLVCLPELLHSISKYDFPHFIEKKSSILYILVCTLLFSLENACWRAFHNSTESFHSFFDTCIGSCCRGETVIYLSALLTALCAGSRLLLLQTSQLCLHHFPQVPVRHLPIFIPG